MLVVWVMLMLLSWQKTSLNVIKSSCQEKCGNVISVPYPFGIDDQSCAYENFLLQCNRNETPPVLIFGNNMIALNISLEEGGHRRGGWPAWTHLLAATMSLGGPTFSVKASHWIGILGNFGSGCVSLCTEESYKDLTDQDSCSGIGCCQTPIPESLKTLNISICHVNDHKEVWRFNPSDYAILADIESTFNISDWEISDTSYFDKTVKSNLTIEWVVKEEITCDEASANSSENMCGPNSKCIYSENGKGYRCLWKDGFHGNPYLPLGCQAVHLACRATEKKVAKDFV
ncbi:hypothetical protein Patl1_30120 [Pistacia atlantica]|uniref:Uncharacterized protein n=1 Tax=Pistacia atlantica TaxID=434234 RepID=A0ACC1AD33_9ROSI|nr:hypothetical protein Patl1_30120 [Pistacia atlantica]